MIGGFLLSFHACLIYIVIDNPFNDRIGNCVKIITSILLISYCVIIMVRTAVFLMIFENIPNISMNYDD
jgi:hypothetical protein